MEEIKPLNQIRGGEQNVQPESSISANEPATNFVCLNPDQYNTALSRYASFVQSMNDKIAEYESTFDQQISPIDFQALLVGDISILRSSFQSIVEERVSNVKSKTLKEMDRKAYLSDGIAFFNGLAYWGSVDRKIDINRVRMENGKAVFDADDARLLLEDEFSVDFAHPAYSGLFEKFNVLRDAYEDVCLHLLNNKGLIKINPRNDSIIKFDGNSEALIYLDKMDGFKMHFNNQTLLGRHWVDER